jgi:hypothetical protein
MKSLRCYPFVLRLLNHEKYFLSGTCHDSVSSLRDRDSGEHHSFRDAARFW